MDLDGAFPPERVAGGNRVQEADERDARRWIEATNERQARVQPERLDPLIGAEFEKALTAHIRSENPNLTVDYNYHGSPPFSFEVGQRPVQHAGNGDFVTGETGVWGFSAKYQGRRRLFAVDQDSEESIAVLSSRAVTSTMGTTRS